MQSICHLEQSELKIGIAKHIYNREILHYVQNALHLFYLQM